MDKISFPYRSSSHLALLHVVAESGAWEKQNLDVDYQWKISATESHRDIPTSDVEFVGGNHVSTYGYRARGDNWVYLGQTVTQVNHKLCVRPDSGISGIADLRGKKIGVRGSHPELNDWVFLKQRGLDVDRGDIEMINQMKIKKGNMDAEPGQEEAEKLPKWGFVKNSKVDACFLTPPQTVFAERAGLKIIDIEPLPMINFTTVSTSATFVHKHPELCERFIKGLLEGIAYFKTQPEKTKAIIKQRHNSEGELDDEMVDLLYNDLARILEPKLYPTMAAIDNVYQEALRVDPDARKVNPLSLWDMHIVRKIDDSGFIDRLYGNKPA
jgi:ABC-type nitrate/sulfonate/bicarbonate transport system substrate-binding protein